MATIRIELRSDKADITGKSPLRLIYQISGQRKFFPIKAKCFPFNWHAESQRLIYLDLKAAKKAASLMQWSKPIKSEDLPAASEVLEINDLILGLIREVRDIETLFKIEKRTATPKTIIDELTSKRFPIEAKDKPGVYITDFITKFVNETTEHRQGTLKEYKSLNNHMQRYEKSKKVRFTFEGDAGLLHGFSNFLTIERKEESIDKNGAKVVKKIEGVNNITRAKLISTFKTILRHAKRPPYKIAVNPDYFEYSVKRKDAEFEVIALTEDELLAVYNLDLSDNRSQDEARDIFCFSCATGLRYSDLAQLRRENIRKDNTIQMTASKNGKKIQIPLNAMSYAILEKYKNDRHPLPVIASMQRLISNQKLNKHIKEIGKAAGIDTNIPLVREYGTTLKKWDKPKYQLLSIHVGRKTFTTLSLSRGMALQDVMSITTHTSFKAVRRYIDVTKEQKKAVMAAAWGSVNKLKAI